MDLQQMMFPFIMAVITNSIMILVMFLLRKSRYFANVFGIGLILVLYFLCILRMILPIELPGLQIILRDDTVYSGVIRFLRGRTELTKDLPFDILTLLLIIWLAVSCILLALFLRKILRFRRNINANMNLATDKEVELLNAIVFEVFGKQRNIMLKKTDAVKSMIVIGLRTPVILLPDTEYDPQELRMILWHECMHIKDKDLWIKLLIEIYRIIFWWNPFSYLLKVDVSDTLESKCDLNVIRNFDKKDKFAYAKTVLKHMSDEDDKSIPFVHSRFSKHRNEHEAELRINTIINKEPDKKKQVALSAIVSILFVAVFAVSYLFIIQPSFGLPAKETEYKNGAVIADDSNCYLVKQEDGSYLFYFLDYPPMLISAEEFDEEMYEGYPILEN